MDLEGQLKKLKQRPGQTVSELVSCLDTLEDQLPEIPSESQRHSNLLHSLHDYLQRAIIRANSQGTTRLALIEAARVAERVEPKPDFVRNATRLHRSTNEERPQRAPSHQLTVTYNKASSSKTSETSKASPAQAAVTSPSRKRPREDTTDSPKITCWNCSKKGQKI